MLFPGPLLIGTILLAIGLWKRERILRVFGDFILAIACILMVYDFYMVADYVSYVSTGLYLESWTDYLGFVGISLVGGLLAGDGLLQLSRKKSSSS